MPSLGVFTLNVIKWTQQKKMCCRIRPCLTTTGWFDSVVLNRDVLSVAIEARSDLFADDPEYTSASYRKAAYHQFVLWQHGYLGKNNRHVVPSCVVWCIRGIPCTRSDLFGIQGIFK